MGGGDNTSSFTQDERLVEGVRVSDKLLGLRALFGFKIANPIYHSIPPKGFFLASDVSAALKDNDQVQQMIDCCDELEREIINFKKHLGLDDKKNAITETIVILDGLRAPTQKNILDKSILYKFQQFRVNYNEENHAQEIWQPMELKDYPKTSEFVKVHLQPALRHNPLLKKHVRKTEVADLEIHRLVMKRYAVKTAQSSGLRSKPKSQRTPSKQRELSFEPIQELVNFMPKLSSYAPPVTKPVEDDTSSISGAEEEDSDGDMLSADDLSPASTEAPE